MVRVRYKSRTSTTFLSASQRFNLTQEREAYLLVCYHQHVIDPNPGVAGLSGAGQNQGMKITLLFVLALAVIPYQNGGAYE